MAVKCIYNVRDGEAYVTLTLHVGSEEDTQPFNIPFIDFTENQVTEM